MKTYLDVYTAMLKQEISLHVQYRVEVALWALGLIIQPVISLAVWAAVARATGGSVDGYTARDFAAYFIVLLVVRHFTTAWVIFTIGGDIRTGNLSGQLMRPINPIHRHLAGNIASKLVNLTVIVPTVIVLILIFQPALHPTAWQVAAFVPALVLAFVLRFLLDWTIGMLGFWITQMSAISQMYALGLLFLSGQIAPLELLPAPIEVLATVLPFRWVAAFPVELLLGRLSAVEVVWGIAAQCGWLALVLIIFGPLWRAGLRQYGAVGA